MSTIQIIQALSLLILIAGSAFFSGSETALMSVNRIRVRNMMDNKIPGAALIHRLLSEPGRLLSTLLIGNNVVNIAGSSIATVLFISLLGPIYGPTYGVATATVVMTIFVLIFGEILPKTLAAHAPEEWARRIARPIKGLMSVLSPLVSLFTRMTNLVLKLSGNVHQRTSLVTEDEIRTVINLGQKEGVLEAEERNMLTSVLEFNDTLAREVMIPRVDVFALDAKLTIRQAAEIAIEQQYSRIPIYRDSIDHIIGIVHVKDILAKLLSEPELPIEQAMRPVILIPEAVGVGPLLERMQKQKVSAVIVLDEYGVTAGLITIEDIVEEIVGDIRDEYDDHEATFEPIDERVTLLDGSLAIGEVNEQLGTELPEDAADTVGGYVFFQLGKIPKVGDTIDFQGWELTVAQMEGRRVAKVKLGRKT